MGSRTKNRLKRDALCHSYSELVAWVKNLDTTQPDWNSYQKESHQLWPGKWVNFPGFEIGLSVFIPPLWDDEAGESRGDYVTWSISIINSKCMEDELYREYQLKDIYLEDLEKIGDIFKKDPLSTWENFTATIIEELKWKKNMLN